MERSILLWFVNVCIGCRLFKLDSLLFGLLMFDFLKVIDSYCSLLQLHAGNYDCRVWVVKLPTWYENLEIILIYLHYSDNKWFTIDIYVVIIIIIIVALFQTQVRYYKINKVGNFQIFFFILSISNDLLWLSHQLP